MRLRERDLEGTVYESEYEAGGRCEDAVAEFSGISNFEKVHLFY